MPYVPPRVLSWQYFQPPSPTRLLLVEGGSMGQQGLGAAGSAGTARGEHGAGGRGCRWWKGGENSQRPAENLPEGSWGDVAVSPRHTTLGGGQHQSLSILSSPQPCIPAPASPAPLSALSLSLYFYSPFTPLTSPSLQMPLIHLSLYQHHPRALSWRAPGGEPSSPSLCPRTILAGASSPPPQKGLIQG